MATLAIDAMGGDNAPEAVVEGVADAAREFDFHPVLVGSREKIEPLLDRFKLSAELVHTDDSVGMDESPRSALREKPDASIALAARLVATGKADALLSAGNTGAVILATAQNLSMIEGIERSALAAVIPSTMVTGAGNRFTLLLDVGATIRCEVEHLVHFALMGHVYAQDVLGVENPRTGLLNVGKEKNKGGHVLTEAYRLLSEIPGLNFTGNVEGNRLTRNGADVVVCDGFTGNVLIKFMEGAARSLHELGRYAYSRGIAYKLAMAVLAPGMKKVRKKFDYAEHGGAPLLGFSRLCIKAHGRSNARAVKNAVRVAVKSAEDDICEKIRRAAREFTRNHPAAGIV